MKWRQPVYTVQHRMVREPEWHIGNSWTPTEVRGLREARSVAHRLRMDNRWASADAHPHVTITDADGNHVPEVDGR